MYMKKEEIDLSRGSKQKRVTIEIVQWPDESSFVSELSLRHFLLNALCMFEYAM